MSTKSMDVLPGCVLLHKTSGSLMDEVRDYLNLWNIEIYERQHLGEPVSNVLLENTPIAIASINHASDEGIPFLRSVMRYNNWTQRMMLAESNDFNLLERAVNKAHVNYLLQFPFEPGKFKKYLIKANKRYIQLNRPFQKINELADLTQDLLMDNERYRLEASTDSLTGLMNRRSFNNILRRIWDRFKENRIPFSIAMFDLDNFKFINDTYGHTAGDAVLKEIADIISRNQRFGMDHAFRYGGDEFAILSTNTRDEEMRSYLERILRLVRSQEFIYNGHKIFLSYSAGVCQARFSGSPENMIALTDGALYTAKESGKNCVRIAAEQD